MKIRSLFVVAVFGCSSVLTGCVSGGNSQSGALLGSIGGALVGQAIGGDTKSTMIGAVVGTMAGYAIGNEMDKADLKNLDYSYENVPPGKTSTWVNPNSKTRYYVTPGIAYTNMVRGTTLPCREAVVIAEIDGKQQRAVTKACRNPGGWWEIM